GNRHFDQVYQHTASRDRNISQPPGRAARKNEVSGSNISSPRAVSDDGQRVVFMTESPALGDEEDTRQIALRDVVTGKTTLVSSTPDGSPASQGAFGATIDAAGAKVAFESSSH